MTQSSKPLNRIIFYWLPAIALCVGIFWQSSYPGILTKSLFPHEDKVLHFSAYALLALLLTRNLMVEKPFWSPLKIKIIAIAFASLYGLSDEIHQAFVSQRDASVYDFLADCAGSLAGCLFYINFLSRRK